MKYLRILVIIWVGLLGVIFGPIEIETVNPESVEFAYFSNGIVCNVDEMLFIIKEDRVNFDPYKIKIKTYKNCFGDAVFRTFVYRGK